jgi:STE24 endopeptidase
MSGLRPPGWLVVPAVALVAAQAGALPVRPAADQVIDPVPVRAETVFTRAQLERARNFRRPQLVLGLSALGIQAAVLALLAVRPPATLRRPWRRPVVASALAGGALSLAVSAAALPVRAVAWERARQVGLVTQDALAWSGDVVKDAAIDAALAAAAAALALALMRRFRRSWWLPGAAALTAAAAVLLLADPVVRDPVFNRFEPLPPGRTRTDVVALARRAGIRVGEVYVMDASRRTRAANAYVAGLGATKRVVLHDNLLRNFTREEIRVIIAHELAHQRYGDLRRGLLYVALVAPFAMAAVAAITARLAGARTGTPAALPALGLALLLVATAVTWTSNGLSRRVEARADAFALRLTDAPAAQIALQRRLALRNVSDPSPPAVVTTLFATHPPVVERIGAARAYAAEAGEASRRRRRAPASQASAAAATVSQAKASPMRAYAVRPPAGLTAATSTTRRARPPALASSRPSRS